MQIKQHPRIERLRETIAGFKGKKFTTTDLRKINNTNHMLSALSDLADSGEIKWCGKTKAKCANIDIWQELNLKKFDTIEPVPEKANTDAEAVAAGDDLPGWRFAFPQLFRDPRIPGKKRRQVEL